MMLNLIVTLARMWRGWRYAQTVQPYQFGSPDDPQAWASYQIWRRSMGL
jgi:hypothetical protein